MCFLFRAAPMTRMRDGHCCSWCLRRLALLRLVLAVTGGWHLLPPDTSCSLETVRQPWDPVERPLIFYTDQTCPSEETNAVDDSAIWSAFVNPSHIDARNESERSLWPTHDANKTIGGLARPLGLKVAGGHVMWLEQDAGMLRRCSMSATTGRCLSAPSVMLDGLNCPQDFAVDFSRNLIFILQYGGGGGPEARQPCGGQGRITRFAMMPAADGSQVPVDIIDGIFEPNSLALDPLADPSGRGAHGHVGAPGLGLLFWSDAGNVSDVNGLGGSVMRGGLDGSGVRQVIHIDKPSGVAVDVSRQALYATSRVRGAPIFHSTYDGMWRKQIGRDLFFEPRGLAVDPTDGSVVVVEFDTFAKGCDPLYQGGYGAFTCGKRNLGRISRVSCAWTADSTIDGRPPAPFQCCCVEPGSNPWGCTLTCPPSPPAPPPPATNSTPSLPPMLPPPPSMPPQPPPLPPGAERVNVSEAVAPQPVRDSRMPPIIDDETLVFVGGFVVSGTKAISWGDPITIAVVTAARRAPPPPPGSWPDRSAGTLYYGRCAAGCGRPAGIDDCRPCEIGTYGDGDGVCRSCPIGWSGIAARSSSLAGGCRSCPPGSYATHAGSTMCTTCPKGSFCADGYQLSQYGVLETAPRMGGIAMPTLCPVGTYNPNTGSTSPADCIACPAGTAQPALGATAAEQCVRCEPGSASRAQSSACSLCRPTSAQPLAGMPECDECPPGTYSNTTGATFCSLCPRGSFFEEAGNSDPNCRVCAPGTYAQDEGTALCTPCPNGTASSLVAASFNETCVPCPPGTYALSPGHAECSPCPNLENSTVQVDLSEQMLAPGAGLVDVQSDAPAHPIEVLEACDMLADSAAARRGCASRTTLALTCVAALVVLASTCTLGSTSTTRRSLVI